VSPANGKVGQAPGYPGAYSQLIGGFERSGKRGMFAPVR
jgi:hypothetical protein